MTWYAYVIGIVIMGSVAYWLIRKFVKAIKENKK